MALQADNIADLVSTTLRELGRLRWTEIATDIQEHVMLPQILKKEKVQFDSGYGIQWNVMTGHGDAARNVGLYATDVVNRADVMQTANIPWRHTTTNYPIDRREVSMNSGSAAKIVDIIKVQRASMMIALAEKMETNGWSKPTDSTDTTDPFGIPYWVVKNSTTGFNGGNPSGFTSGAGNLSSTTYPRWANWTAQYVNVTKADAVKKMREAASKTNFKSPVNIPSYNRGDRYVLYCNYATYSAFEELGEAQNENLGKDIASMDGRIVFRGNPIQYVPNLDSDSTDPVYGINWGVFFPVFLRGEYLRETMIDPMPAQHTVTAVHVDMTYNLKCCDRRRLWVVSK